MTTQLLEAPARLDVADVEKLIMAGLRERGASTFPGVVDARQLVGNEVAHNRLVDPSALSTAIENLEDRGEIERVNQPAHNGSRAGYEVQLPRTVALELILKNRLFYKWVDSRPKSLFSGGMLHGTRGLLADHLEHALQSDARGTFEAAVASVAPKGISPDVRNHARRALASTTLGAGALNPVRFLRMMLGLADFPGTPRDLVDMCLAVLTDTSS